MKTGVLKSAAFLAVLLAGCASQVTTDSSQPGQDSSSATTRDGAGPAAKTPDGRRAAVDPRLPVKVPGEIRMKGNVYYELDQFDIKAEYRPLVESHARYLRQRPQTKLVIQGHGDERGSREYNVALGQRRSEGVKKMLLLQGVKEVQVEAISFGEEKPAAVGHDETFWSLNRRSEIVYGD